MANRKQTGKKGLALIKQKEGYRDTAYLCSANVPTIGYGHTGPDVTHADVGKKKITISEAEELLRRDLKTAETAVNDNVKVPLTQNQFDALVSLTYNIGGSRFKDSTCLKKLNAGDYRGSMDELQGFRLAGGKVLNGLVIRRKEERQLFETPDD